MFNFENSNLRHSANFMAKINKIDVFGLYKNSEAIVDTFIFDNHCVFKRN
jgi:hypothetical protein